MATEEQLVQSGYKTLGTDQNSRAGQRLTIAARTVTKLSFKLASSGSPTGNITYTIRAVEDDEILVSKVLGDASIISAYPTFTFYEVTWDDPILINEEVRIMAEYAGDGAGKLVVVGAAGDVREDWSTAYDGEYLDGDADATFIYTYEDPPKGGQGGSAELLVAQGII